MRIQEDRSWTDRKDGLAESPKEFWKVTQNKLHKMLYDYFDITEGVVIERAHRVEERYKLKKDLVQLLQSYLITMTKSTSWKTLTI